MKKKINAADYAGKIMKMLPKGILLNTKADTFDSMVIGWGQIGINWGMPVFTVYVRECRYTRKQLDKNPEFTISLPLDQPVAQITRVCGTMSGYDTDKVSEAGLILEEPETNSVPGVRQYPLTLECRVLYREKQDYNQYPEKVRKFYPQAAAGQASEAGSDIHVMYIGEIVDAYIIE